MSFHDVLVHLQNNWHKWGVALLLLKEARTTYKFFAGLKSVQETFSWVVEKIKKLFGKA